MYSSAVLLQLSSFAMCFSYIFGTQPTLNLFIELQTVSVSDGRLENGARCSSANFDCSLWMSVCVDPLDSTISHSTCARDYFILGELTTESNSFTFSKKKQYGEWFNPQAISLRTDKPEGFIFKCNLYQATNHLPIDSFKFNVTYESGSIISYVHKKKNGGFATLNFVFTANPQFVRSQTTTMQPPEHPTVNLSSIEETVITSSDFQHENENQRTATDSYIQLHEGNAKTVDVSYGNASFNSSKTDHVSPEVQTVTRNSNETNVPSSFNFNFSDNATSSDNQEFSLFEGISLKNITITTSSGMDMMEGNDSYVNNGNNSTLSYSNGISPNLFKPDDFNKTNLDANKTNPSDCVLEVGNETLDNNSVASTSSNTILLPITPITSEWLEISTTSTTEIIMSITVYDGNYSTAISPFGNTSLTSFLNNIAIKTNVTENDLNERNDSSAAENAVDTSSDRSANIFHQVRSSDNTSVDNSSYIAVQELKNITNKNGLVLNRLNIPFNDENHTTAYSNDHEYTNSTHESNKSAETDRNETNSTNVTNILSSSTLELSEHSTYHDKIEPFTDVDRNGFTTSDKSNLIENQTSNLDDAAYTSPSVSSESILTSKSAEPSTYSKRFQENYEQVKEAFYEKKKCKGRGRFELELEININ